jgi:hypothetical protein
MKKHLWSIGTLLLGFFISAYLLWLALLPNELCRLFGGVYLVIWFPIWYLLLLNSYEE